MRAECAWCRADLGTAAWEAVLMAGVAQAITRGASAHGRALDAAHTDGRVGGGHTMLIHRRTSLTVVWSVTR